jgi:hypothetical protein
VRILEILRKIKKGSQDGISEGALLILLRKRGYRKTTLDEKEAARILKDHGLSFRREGDRFFVDYLD